MHNVNILIAKVIRECCIKSAPKKFEHSTEKFMNSSKSNVYGSLAPNIAHTFYISVFEFVPHFQYISKALNAQFDVNLISMSLKII